MNEYEDLRKLEKRVAELEKCRPDWLRGYRDGKKAQEQIDIAEFIETIKQELGYIETINFYSGNVQCISIKTLKEQFGHIIKEYEGRRKE